MFAFKREKGILFVLSAPSGAGKTSIRKRLFARLKGLYYSVSHSTRRAREGEEDGVDYYFVSTDRFQEMIQSKDFLEWAEVHGNYYGTSITEIEKNVEQGLDVILDIDVQGAAQIVDSYHSGPIVTIFVLPPSGLELRERLLKRASENESELVRRLENAPKEASRFLEYDYVVVNRELEEATNQVCSIVWPSDAGRVICLQTLRLEKLHQRVSHFRLCCVGSPVSLVAAVNSS